MMKYARFRIACLLAVVAGLGLFASHADAQVYNRFGPANGVLKGDTSTYQTTAAVSADIRALWSGTCDAATFLRGDGSCQVPAGTTAGANPTATIGLTAVNGVATTFLRSDGAPALSQSISPTWTGTHTWNQNMTLTKADPRLCLYDSGSDATFFWRMSSDVLRLNIVDGSTCTTTGASAPFAITSAAGTASAIGITSTALTWNGLDMVNTASTPTWTGAHTFSSSSGAISLNSVNPALQWNESDQGLDEKLWNLIASSGSLQFQTRTDAGGAGTTPFSMSRSGTGTTVNTITLNATSSVITGNARLTTLAGTAANPNLQITSASPNFALFENDAAVDNGLWVERPVAEQLRWSACSDSGGTCTDYLTVDRTGTVVDRVATAASDVRFPLNAVGNTVNVGYSAFNGAGAIQTRLLSDGSHTAVAFHAGTSIELQDTLATTSGTVNDLNLQTPVWRLSGASAITVTGIVATSGTGQYLKVYNGKTANLTLANEDAGSAAANRFSLQNSANRIVPPGESVGLWYDDTSNRWVVIDGTSYPAPTTVSGHTVNGFSSVSFNSVKYTKYGRQVCINIDVGGVSNATTFTITGLALPAPDYVGVAAFNPMVVQNNGGNALGNITIAAAQITFGVGGTAGGFTASGSKSASGMTCYMSTT